MDDQAIVYLYAALFAAFSLMAFGGFYRLWLNHIDRRQIRLALVSFSSLMGFLAVDTAYRTRARMLDVGLSRAVLNSWHFWSFETLTLACAVWLFLVLQRPHTDRRRAPHSDSYPANMNRRTK